MADTATIPNPQPQAIQPIQTWQSIGELAAKLAQDAAARAGK